MQRLIHSRVLSTSLGILRKKRNVRTPTKTAKSESAIGNVGMAAFFKQFGAVEHRDAWYKENLNPEIEKLKKNINFENLDRESLETANLNPDALKTLAAINTIDVKTNHLYRLHLSKNYKNLPEDEKKSYSVFKNFGPTTSVWSFLEIFEVFQNNFRSKYQNFHNSITHFTINSQKRLMMK